MWCRLAVVCSVVLLLSTGAHALSAEVPQQVYASTVPVVVPALGATDVASVTVGGQTVTGTPGQKMILVPNVTIGVHAWQVTVGNETTGGHVHVAMHLGILQAALTGARQDLAALQTNVSTNDKEVTADLGSLSDRLDTVVAELAALQTALAGQTSTLTSHESVVLARFVALENATTEASASAAEALQGTQEALGQLEAVAGSQDATQRSAGAARAASVASTSLTAIASVLVLLAAGYLWWDSRRLHKQSMMLLLAFSAKSGLTPESEELKQAAKILGR